ncbi:MAG: mannose-6-phosphate isomerase [Bacteroidetes bacterium MedPE-SWsnd-G2]|nr:MAG: mannose-6-phosphate isomerase [Bacteroidetes bacterium MedPE-SWsnd-G2]
MKAIDISSKFSKFKTTWHPHIIAEVDDMNVIIAKFKGDFDWHKHDNEDELFQVIKGTIKMHFRDRVETVKEGELIVVPKGIEHKPATLNNEVAHVLLFEKKNLAHTGETITNKTITDYPKI